MRLSTPVAVLLIPAMALAQQASLSVEKIRQIEQVVASEMARNTIPAVTLAIRDNAGLRWSNGSGMADVENLLPAATRTPHSPGSIFKPITAPPASQCGDNWT